MVGEGVNQVLFDWNDEFNIGLQQVDEQHKELVRLLNELHVALREQQASTTCRDILDALADHTRIHFETEEALMRVSGFPELGAHKQNHDDLLGQVRALQEKLAAGQAEITFELLYFLKQWLIHHVNEADKRFGNYFVQSGSGTTQQSPVAQHAKAPWWKFW